MQFLKSAYVGTKERYFVLFNVEISCWNLTHSTELIYQILKWNKMKKDMGNLVYDNDEIYAKFMQLACLAILLRHKSQAKLQVVTCFAIIKSRYMFVTRRYTWSFQDELNAECCMIWKLAHLTGRNWWAFKWENFIWRAAIVYLAFPGDLADRTLSGVFKVLFWQPGQLACECFIGKLFLLNKISASRPACACPYTPWYKRTIIFQQSIIRRDLAFQAVSLNGRALLL